MADFGVPTRSGPRQLGVTLNPSKPQGEHTSVTSSSVCHYCLGDPYHPGRLVGGLATLNEFSPSAHFIFPPLGRNLTHKVQPDRPVAVYLATNHVHERTHTSGADLDRRRAGGRNSGVRLRAVRKGWTLGVWSPPVFGGRRPRRSDKAKNRCVLLPPLCCFDRARSSRGVPGPLSRTDGRPALRDRTSANR